jgi:hypothetical protein
VRKGRLPPWAPTVSEHKHKGLYHRFYQRAHRLTGRRQRLDTEGAADLQGQSKTIHRPGGVCDRFRVRAGGVRWLILRSGRYTKAAVLHDYLWRHCPDDITRSEADGLFRRALQDLEVPFLRRWLMWAAVRWNSLLQSRFANGTSDIFRVLLVTLMPGLAVIAADLIVLALLLAFYVLDGNIRGPVALRRIPSIKEHARLKDLNRPTVLWSTTAAAAKA